MIFKINNLNLIFLIKLFWILFSALFFIILDATKIEVEVKSDVNAKTTMLPKGDLIKNYGNDLLDMQVAQTDMKVRHIFKKFVEVHTYLLNYTSVFLKKNMNSKTVLY